ncbi:hypothetical protein M0D21_10010 [Aquimarina sp. D1M17]|uniref:hypothetical protein n=1 Tax=Aquimarina acroporae TaxID=2937283 RepID=UPI0020BE8F00|nr:hypothetical protein [Aquimarina acroporae]MCK8521902.1 hypothetical protein [Aquimarina acroporae]
MKKRYLYILGLILIVFQSCFSQSISRREFKKTRWFTSNKDSLFFKSDTIRFIKYSNKSKKEDNMEFCPETLSFYDVESIQLWFTQNRYMNFLKQDFHIHTIKLNKWILGKKDSTLTLESEKKINYFFKIIRIKNLEFESNGQKFVTKEMILKKEIPPVTN